MAGRHRPRAPPGRGRAVGRRSSPRPASMPSIIVGAPPTDNGRACWLPAQLAQTGIRAVGAGAAAGCAGSAAAAGRRDCTGCTAAKSIASSSFECSTTPRASTSRTLASLRVASGLRPDATASASVMIRGHRCIRQVGSGGMCKIYLAESERAGTLVVLKVFSQVPDVSERIVGFDRFLQEYEIVAGLKHRNIVRIYDLGVADDHAYIAMEHFPAGDLRQRMKTPLEPATALHFLEQMASALDAIHAVGVLHRDLKPANVMLRDRWIALLDRFRPGQGERARRRFDRHARDLRHPLLHEPGAGTCRADRRAQRPVQPGRRVLTKC